MAEYKYRVRTDRGEFIITLDQEVPDTEAGQRLLQDLVTAQYATERDGLRTIGQQALGGVRDAAQGWINIPTDIASVVGEYLSPDPPGGPRRRLLPEFQPPVRLPEIEPPVGEQEQWLRTGTNVATNLAVAAMSPTVRQMMSRLIFGRAPGVPMLFEPGRAVSRGGIAGAKPVGTIAPAAGQLAGEFSDAAAQTARLVGIDGMQAVRDMTLQQALAARGRISRLVSGNLAELEELAPLREVYDAVEQRVLSFR